MSQSKMYLMTDPAAVAAKVKSAGGPAIDPTQPTGTATADGVTIGWSVAAMQLTVTIIKKPFFVPYNDVWGHIASVLGDPIA
jgi:hypothetical protein